MLMQLFIILKQWEILQSHKVSICMSCTLLLYLFLLCLLVQVSMGLMTKIDRGIVNHAPVLCSPTSNPSDIILINEILKSFSEDLRVQDIR